MFITRRKCEQQWLLVRIHFVILLLCSQEASSIQCYWCINDCLKQSYTQDKINSCGTIPMTGEFCAITATLRPNPDKPTQLQPAMERVCSKQGNPVDNRAWAILSRIPGRKMVCYVQPISTHAGMYAGKMERYCICKEDKCNFKFWDDLMIMPLLPENFKDTDVAVDPTLGTLGYNEILGITKPYVPTKPSVAPAGTETTDGDVNPSTATNGGGEGLTSGENTGTSGGVTPRGNASSVGATKNPNAAAEDDGGMGTGALVGIIVGALAMIGLAGAAVWWFVVRKPGKDDEEEESEESEEGEESGVSGEDSEE